MRFWVAASGIQGHFDVVVANILAGPLVRFAESITLTLRGRGMLALSGILCEQADEVMAAYEPWVEFDDPEFQGTGRPDMVEIEWKTESGLANQRVL